MCLACHGTDHVGQRDEVLRAVPALVSMTRRPVAVARSLAALDARSDFVFREHQVGLELACRDV
jgi:hypothetical protein